MSTGDVAFIARFYPRDPTRPAPARARCPTERVPASKVRVLAERRHGSHHNVRPLSGHDVVRTIPGSQSSTAQPLMASMRSAGSASRTTNFTTFSKLWGGACHRPPSRVDTRRTPRALTVARSLIASDRPNLTSHCILRDLPPLSVVNFTAMAVPSAVRMA